MDTIKVDINKEENSISIYNNGKGIPVEIHAVEKVYVPELIFGHLLTSSNYDDLEKKVTGGRNGYGAKLCNIFSNEFTIETADLASKRKFRQVSYVSAHSPVRSYRDDVALHAPCHAIPCDRRLKTT